MLSNWRCILGLDTRRPRRAGSCARTGVWKAPPSLYLELANAGLNYNSDTVWQPESKAVELMERPIWMKNLPHFEEM